MISLSQIHRHLSRLLICISESCAAESETLACCLGRGIGSALVVRRDEGRRSTKARPKPDSGVCTSESYSTVSSTSYDSHPIMSAAYKRASTLIGLPDLDRGWEEVQAKTFMKWLNTKLALQDIPPMTSLVRDLADGVLLIQLMEIMGGVSLGRYYKSPRMRVQMAENVNKALDFIKSRGVVLTNCGAEDVLDGNGKIILGLIWTLILRFTIADIRCVAALSIPLLHSSRPLLSPARKE